MKTILANTIELLKIRNNGNSNCETMIKYCGRNTGNVCFADAMVSQLNYEDEIRCYNIGEYSEKAVFVLPASSWIGANGNVLRMIFSPLENKDVSLVVIGLGIQGSIDESTSSIVDKLSEDTISALKIMSEHSVSIGLRGEITASVLEKLGIYNYKIVGCPSFYEPFRYWGRVNDWNKDFNPEKVVCGVTPYNNYEHKILELAYEEQNDLVLQSMDDLPLTLLENQKIEKRHIDGRFPQLDIKPYELKTYIQKKGKIFYSRESWSEYLYKQDISFAWGTRFHGNMMAFSNGIPALWIIHDARTKEMVDAMKLPHLSYKQFADIKSVLELCEKCSYDDSFKKSYREMAMRYIDFLDENKVSHTFNI